MRDEHMIDRQGRKHVLFAGLLDEAHTKGLNMIETDLIQIPDESNGEVAIVKAVVKMDDERRFSGIGDASPDNVGRSIAPHLIRMAETRAKARALRDAINVGMVALEELTDQEEGEGPARQGRSQSQGRGRKQNQRRQYGGQNRQGGDGGRQGDSHIQEAPPPESEEPRGSEDQRQQRQQGPTNLQDGSASDGDKIQLATLIGQAGRDTDKFEENYGLIKDVSDQFCRYWIGRLERQIEAQRG